LSDVVSKENSHDLRRFNRASKRKRRDRVAVSNLAFTAITVILLITSAAGYALWVTKPVEGAATTVTVDQSGSIASSTVASTLAEKLAQTPGFFNGTVVTITYPYNYNCTPSLLTFFVSQTASANLTNCEVGAGKSTAEANAVPL
jgi:hypothetical protein